jgi:hypothetical protein
LDQRLHDRPQQRFQPLQPVGDGAGRQVQPQQPPLFQQPRRRPMTGELVQQDFDPHRHAQKRLGDQLVRRRRRDGARPRTVAGPLTAPPVDHPAIHGDFDFDLFRIFAAARFQRAAAMGTGLLRFRQVDELLPSGQMTVIATAGSRLTGLAAAATLGRVVGRILELIGAVAGGLLLGTASKAFGLQFANFAAELLVFLLQRRDTPDGVGMSAAPIAGLHPQFQVLTPQSGRFGAQLIDFPQESRNQRRQIRVCGSRIQR